MGGETTPCCLEGIDHPNGREVTHAPDAPALYAQSRPDVLATARAQRGDPAEVLRLLITEEVTGRDAATCPTPRAGPGLGKRHGRIFLRWSGWAPIGSAGDQFGGAW
jgi:hypothetical protein